MADVEVVTPVEEVVAEKPAEPDVAQEELPLEPVEEKPETAEAKPEEKPAEVVEEPKPDWRERELKRKHAQIMEARRALEAKDAEIAALKSGQAPDTAQVDATAVEARAQELLAQQRYIESCNAANEAGQKSYGPQWKASVERLEQLGGFDLPTMRGIMATGAPDKALYLLGTNPDEYHRIMDLPFERRIVEITKLTERTTAAPKPVSQAPAPVRPVGGTAAPPRVELNDKMSDDEWYAAAKAARAKRKAGLR